MLGADIVRLFPTILPPILKALQHMGADEDSEDPISLLGGDASVDVVCLLFICIMYNNNNNSDRVSLACGCSALRR